jgi:hypothetical protein
MLLDAILMFVADFGKPYNRFNEIIRHNMDKPQISGVDKKRDLLDLR